VKALVEFGILVVIAIAAGAVVFPKMIARRTRNAARSDSTQSSNDATGYMTGVWLLGGGESATLGNHAHHPGADAGGAHGADASGGDAGGGDSGGGDGGSGH
jgi:hypothetical protein